MLIYRTYVTLIFSADIAHADFNGNFKYSTSALSHQAISYWHTNFILYRYQPFYDCLFSRYIPLQVLAFPVSSAPLLFNNIPRTGTVMYKLQYTALLQG